ncbi:5141_t:CDS:2 [Diversispora eburnea]|uniref:5141_t:CDS:1 n=1 Tax=Diversispora eburnea TaxID=1213867 RepID=A0A9N9G0K9_9GLOM|nr:5141_t:CDS:2 [Diversispora eburnea]
MYATKHGFELLIEFLIQNGHEDVELSRDFENNTTLMIAAQYNRIKVAAWDRYQAVTLLIERGCQFAVKNNAGWTALDYSYSMELKAHLQECARTHYEEKKKYKKRNQHLKIKVDSLITLDSVPLISSTRSATLPSGTTYYGVYGNNGENVNNSGSNCEGENRGLSSSIPNDSLSPNYNFNLNNVLNLADGMLFPKS